MRETKFLRFVEQPILPNRKALRIYVMNRSNDAVLGEIKWYGAWRQYCFFPHEVILSYECLEDIAKVCEEYTSPGIIRRPYGE